MDPREKTRNDGIPCGARPSSAGADLLEVVLGIGDPVKAAKALVAESVRVTGASTGRLYWLNVSNSTFGVMAEHARSDVGKTPEIDLNVFQRVLAGRGAPTRPPSLLEEVIFSRNTLLLPRLQDGVHGERSRYHNPGAQSRVIVPVVREGICVGLLDLDSKKECQFGNGDLETLRVAAGAAALLFEKHEAMTLLRTIQRPISFHQPWNEFVDELVLLAAEATQMPYLALREWDRKNRLECIGGFGFDDLDKSELDIEPLEEFPPFFEAVTLGEPQVEPDMRISDMESLRGRTVLKKITSLVVAPVMVGETVFGTLSVGAECPCTYTQLERHGLVTVANTIGLAISNYRNAAVREETLTRQVHVGNALTAVEVAQAARHEARNSLSQAALVSTTIRMLCNVQGKIDRPEVLSTCEKLGERLKEIDHSLDKIKNITRPPEREIQRVGVEKVWREAFDLVNSRLAQLRVRRSIVGPEIQVDAYPDHLRHAFLNIILNSIDAFKNVRRRADRHIRVYIEPASEGTETVRMRYRDNATGIDLARLRPVEAGTVRPVSDIFEPGVTSRPDGSGYGLYLVRRILHDHRGSIEIKDWRNGVVFEMTIAMRLADHCR